ncbi:MAG TPA: cytochrome P450 [Thermoanaerobaculia bacterium]|nr:cytochrome P450 [Thermoanaerobaculia bacterium]
MSESAPGPGLGVIAHLPRLRRDPLGTLLAYHREYGDVVRLGDGPFTVHLLGHPSHAEHVLKRQHKNYDRQTRSAAAVRLVTGESLLTNDGEHWKTHRLLLQPLFNKDALGSLNAIVLEATNAMIDRWLAQEEIDIAAEMMQLTSTVASRAFFGVDVDEDLARLMPLILEETYARATSVFGWGRPSRDFERACDDVREAVDRILSKGDSPLRALPNEAIALLLAGHETTANALAWTFALIGENECDSTAAVQEAMRLYPPIWIVERRAIEDDVIDGFEIPAGSTVYVSPYVLHRHRDFWRNPEEFDPSRFPDAARSEAYLPFGCGPHACLGAAFAMIEAPLVVTTVRDRCRIRLRDGSKIEPRAWITLRPTNGVRVQVTESR